MEQFQSYAKHFNGIQKFFKKVQLGRRLYKKDKTIKIFIHAEQKKLKITQMSKVIRQIGKAIKCHLHST